MNSIFVVKINGISILIEARKVWQITGKLAKMGVSLPEEVEYHGNGKKTYFTANGKVLYEAKKL